MKYRIHFFLKLCLIALSFGITNFINAQIIEVKSIYCNGDSTGQIGVYINNDNVPLTYLWNNGKKTQTIDGLKKGTYTVTVTDATLKDSIVSYTLNEPAKLNTGIVKVANSIWPNNNGSFTITATGGSGWYKYSVLDSTAQQVKNQPTPAFSKLASGSYFVKTTDLYGCQKLDTVRIKENAGLAITPAILTVDTTACYRSTVNASIKPDIFQTTFPATITFDTGKSFLILDTTMKGGPYVIPSLKPGILTDTVGGFSETFKPGFHMVTLVDALGKGFRYSWTVDTILADISLTWTQGNIACYGAKSGSISAKAQGSWNGFTYTISGPGFSGTSSSAGGLGAGVYTIGATDYTGCSVVQSVTISEPHEPLHIVFNDPTPSSCITAKNGAVSINRVDGSVGTLNYNWSTGANTNGINSLFSGLYTVAVSDGNGCAANDKIFVGHGDGATGVVFFDPIKTTCPTAKNGNAKINRVDGATKPLVYSWSNGNSTDEINAVYAGNYSVTITDANNCSINDKIMIEVSNEPFHIFFDDPKKTRCPYANDGAITIHSLEGFTNPVQYVWANGEITPDIDSLSIGMYTITVTDINTCIKVDSIEVKSEKGSCIYNIVTPNGDGYNDFFDISDLCMGKTRKAEIFNENGKVIAKLDDTNLRWNGIDPSNPPTGPSSAFTVFIEVYNGNVLYKKWAETISVIYTK